MYEGDKYWLDKPFAQPLQPAFGCPVISTGIATNMCSATTNAESAEVAENIKQTMKIKTG